MIYINRIILFILFNILLAQFCNDPLACNYEPGVEDDNNWEECYYPGQSGNQNGWGTNPWSNSCDCDFNTVDECGVCGGQGAVLECGCSDIPNGACDCNGTLPTGCDETCGSTLEFDECGVCDGPGFYTCENGIVSCDQDECPDDVYVTSIKFYDDVDPNSSNPGNYLNPNLPIRFKLLIVNDLNPDILDCNPCNLLTASSTISTSEAGVTILDGDGNINNISANGGTQWTTDEFEILVDFNILGGKDLTFNIQISSELDPTGPWNSEFVIPLPIQPLIVSNFYMDDDDSPDSNGDNDDIIDPGETIEFIPLIDNQSNYILDNVTGTLSSSTSAINVWEGIVVNYAGPISLDAMNVQPFPDFVFDYNFESNYQFLVQLLLGGYIDSNISDDIQVKWYDDIILNSDFPLSTSNFISLPADISIFSYPNPFNPITQINYNLEDNQNIKINIFNVNGEFIETIYSGFHMAGNYQTIWDASQFSSGIYFIVLEGKSFKTIQKVVLQK